MVHVRLDQCTVYPVSQLQYVSWRNIALLFWCASRPKGSFTQSMFFHSNALLLYCFSYLNMWLEDVPVLHLLKCCAHDCCSFRRRVKLKEILHAVLLLNVSSKAVNQEELGCRASIAGFCLQALKWLCQDILTLYAVLF